MSNSNENNFIVRRIRIPLDLNLKITGIVKKRKSRGKDETILNFISKELILPREPKSIYPGIIDGPQTIIVMYDNTHDWLKAQTKNLGGVSDERYLVSIIKENLKFK
jgi:hypothetical protein